MFDAKIMKRDTIKLVASLKLIFVTWPVKIDHVSVNYTELYFR